MKLKDEVFVFTNFGIVQATINKVIDNSLLRHCNQYKVTLNFKNQSGVEYEFLYTEDELYRSLEEALTNASKWL